MSNTTLFAVLLAGLVGLALLFAGPPEGNEVSFAFKNLPDLPRGFVYQAWVLDSEDALISLGRFRLIENARNYKFPGDLRYEKKFVVSLETGDPDGVGDLNGPGPDLILFAGGINPLDTITHLSLIAKDLDTPSHGVYFLRTPTDDSSNARSKLKNGIAYNDHNDEQGIWFATIDPETGNVVSGFELPRVPSENFVYQAWLHHASSNTYVTTGRFLDPSVPDWNAGQSPFDGGKVHLGPLTPGEDFINPGITVGGEELPLTLNEGWETFVAIEPHSSSDDTPFVLVAWLGKVGSGTSCFYDTVIAQPNPTVYQQQKCLVEPQFDGVAVIH